MSKVLVVGATGNVGRKLVALLVQKDETVKAATRSPEEYEAVSDKIEAVRFDYGQPETFDGALADVDRLFMLAMPADTEADKHLIPFIDAAQAAGVRRVVLMTAMGVDQAEGAPLWKVEQHLQGSGVAYTILRPNWFMDNFTTGFIQPMIVESKAIYLPAGEAKSSFIAAQDIAGVAAEALTDAGHQNQGYTLTGSEALTYHEAAQILSEASGETIQYVPISDEAMRENMSQAGFPEDGLDYFSALFEAVRAGYAAPISPTVEAVLGRPPMTLRAFAEAHAEVLTS